MHATDPLVGYQVSRTSGRSRLEVLAEAQAAGAGLLEVFLDRERPGDVGSREAGALASAARGGGLKLQVHGSYGFQDNLGAPPLDATFRLAAALGADVVTVHLQDLLAASAPVDFELARRLGLVVGVENEPRGRPEAMLAYLASVPAGAPVGVTLDVGHANLAGTPLGYARTLLPGLRRLGRAIVNVHLHDNRGDDDHHLVLGEGSIDFAPLLPFLRDEAGCRRFVIERWDGRDLCRARALAWLGGRP
jgi:sugar phosphate isomerase/epimerase